MDNCDGLWNAVTKVYKKTMSWVHGSADSPVMAMTLPSRLAILKYLMGARAK